jgi:hypothetical protein
MDISSWCRLYLASKPSHVGVDVDELPYPLHYPTTCSCQMRGHGLLPSATLSHRAVVCGGAFPGDAKPPGLDIRWRVDHPGTCVTEFYMGYIVFTRTCLPYVRVIMAFMRASLAKLPLQIVMDGS